MSSDPVVARLAAFVASIGIEVREAELPASTFLPGLEIRGGSLCIDVSRLAYPGDILHEAGHLAVTDPAQRMLPQFAPDDGDEMATLAWSYAAACHLGIDPAVVFHAHGYKGGASALVENFTKGRYVGVPLLQAYGMTVEPRQAKGGVKPYPHMLRWLR